MRGHIAVCFTAGVVGAAAVLIFSVLLYHMDISPPLGVTTAPKLAPPGIYQPMFWGGLWGIPFALITWQRGGHYYLIGWLYFLAPVLALYFIFAPMRGIGIFGLSKGLPYTFYLLLVNAPYGIVTALAAKWLSSSTGG
jgi:hypothetical protein